MKKPTLDLRLLGGWKNTKNILPIWMFPKIGGTPKSSILIGFSIINHPFWGTPIFGNTHIYPKQPGALFFIAQGKDNSRKTTVSSSWCMNSFTISDLLECEQHQAFPCPRRVTPCMTFEWSTFSFAWIKTWHLSSEGIKRRLFWESNNKQIISPKDLRISLLFRWLRGWISLHIQKRRIT